MDDIPGGHFDDFSTRNAAMAKSNLMDNKSHSFEKRGVPKLNEKISTNPNTSLIRGNKLTPQVVYKSIYDPYQRNIVSGPYYTNRAGTLNKNNIPSPYDTMVLPKGYGPGDENYASLYTYRG
jgi:hypothetical protein